MQMTGNCHCGAVQFAFDCEPNPKVLDCNCSICHRSGYLHLIVPMASLQFISGTDALTDYRFGTGIARHCFCRHCGIKPLYQPRSHPQRWSVNLRCVENAAQLNAMVRPFDGANWERARAELD